MEWMDKILMGLCVVWGTMWFVKNICKMKMFKEWGMTKHFVLTVVLLVVSFYFKYFSICYAGIDEAMMWVRVLENELVFPRYVLVFVLVNLVFPGILVLFFRTIEGDESFWELSYGATSCITVAGFSWHFIYMYPEVDESIACFSVITIAIMIFYSYIGKKCKSFSRRVFAIPAILMPSLRWGYAIFMNLGLLPNIEYFVGLPFMDRYVAYDLMCLAILGVCMLWEEKDRKMLRVRTPAAQVSMVIHEDTLAEIIDKKTCGNEGVKLQMKRFFFATAEEVEDFCGWIQFISYVYRKGLVEAIDDNREEIVMRAKNGEEYIYLVGENEEELNDVKVWLEKFMDRELEFSHYILPRNLFF